MVDGFKSTLGSTLVFTRWTDAYARIEPRQPTRRIKRLNSNSPRMRVIVEPKPGFCAAARRPDTLLRTSFLKHTSINQQQQDARRHIWRTTTAKHSSRCLPFKGSY